MANNHTQQSQSEKQMSKSSQRYLDEFGPINPNEPYDNPTPLDVAMDHPDWHHAMGVAIHALNLVLFEQDGRHDATFYDVHNAAIELTVESILNQSIITKEKAYLSLGYPVEDMPQSMFDDDFPPPF